MKSIFARMKWIYYHFTCYPELSPPGVDLNRLPGNLTTWGAGTALPCVPPPTVGGTGVGANVPPCTSATRASSTAATAREKVFPAVSEYARVLFDVPFPELPLELMVKNPEASWRSEMVEPRRKGAGWRVRM